MKLDCPEVCDFSYCKSCPFLKQFDLLEETKKNTDHFPPEDEQRSNMWY